jgi:hypothetical protein
MGHSLLEMDDIQGDILQGLPKNAEKFIFLRLSILLSFGNW